MSELTEMSTEQPAATVAFNETVKQFKLVASENK